MIYRCKPQSQGRMRRPSGTVADGDGGVKIGCFFFRMSFMGSPIVECNYFCKFFTYFIVYQCWFKLVTNLYEFVNYRNMIVN